MDKLKSYQIFITIFIIIFCIMTVITKCTYTSYCKYCGTIYETDLYVPTQPNIHKYKYCPVCGKQINIGVYNNLEKVFGNEDKELVK